MFFNLFEKLLDILFPRKQAIRELERMDVSEFSSRAGKAESRAGKNILSCFDYRDPLVRQAIWELKYRGNKKVAKLLGAVLHDELLAFLEEYAPLTNFTEPLLIPVPLSTKRESERGFNQCRLLVNVMRELDSEINFTVSSALKKTKDTQSQTKADSRKKRLENLKGCFSADRAAVAGRNIILIDDVATTGATLDEARRTLRGAGAKKVIAFTVAH
ncbi:MAG: phosphoribosyltransferase family protein [bacterium]|nr:phosphoribosyltransferase family protein [bacterium]